MFSRRQIYYLNDQDQADGLDPTDDLDQTDDLDPTDAWESTLTHVAASALPARSCLIVFLLRPTCVHNGFFFFFLSSGGWGNVHNGVGRTNRLSRS